MTGWINVAIAGLVAALISPPLIGGAASDSIVAARDLYAAAEYEDALQMLTRLESTEGGGGADTRSVAQVRAYCLLALGRANDATTAIAVVVAADPTYRPSGADASPRVRAAFGDVRRRLLPAIIQQQYRAARSRYDAEDFAVARDAFARLLDLMADPDVAEAAAQPPLSDLRTLVAGFKDLSTKAAVPPPIESRQQPQAAVNAAVLTPRIYSAEDRLVTAPTILRQSMPPFTLQGVPVRTGVLELLIDEQGNVEDVIMRAPVAARYDSQLVSAAREWRYMPAMLEGHAVKYRKLMQVSVQPAK